MEAENKNTNSQLIIELARLRNKVYELEGLSSQKSLLSQRVEELESKLEHTAKRYKNLNSRVKTILESNRHELKRIVLKSDNTDEKQELEKRVKKISERPGKHGK